jgi:hypothetical protein
MLVPWIIAITCLADVGEQPAPVAPVDWSELTPADFSEHELELPFALAHFHRLANSVRREQPDGGFIDLHVWRNAKDNRPYNARVPKLSVQVRTHDNLLELLASGESPAWVIAGDRVPRITNVQVVNWDGTQMIEGVFDPESRRREDGRLVLRFFDAHIANCRVAFDGQNPVRYIDG